MRLRERRAEATYLVDRYKKPVARICHLLGLSVSVFGYQEKPKNDKPIKEKLEGLIKEHRRFGHPKLFVMIKQDMPAVNHKRTSRIYREMGLQISRRKRKKVGGRPRLPATTATLPNGIWTIDFGPLTLCSTTWSKAAKLKL